MEKIKSVIQNIIEDLEIEKFDHSSLYGGISGKILLKAFYNKVQNKNYININDDFEKLIDLASSENLYTFSNGKSGVNWLFSYLFDDLVIDKDDYSVLCSDVPFLEKISFDFYNQNNWDFLHGGLGISYYALYNRDRFSIDYFERVYNELFRICDLGKMKIFPDFDYFNNSLETERVNLGLAHGIPSVIKFCIESYKKDISKINAKKLAYRLIDFLLENNFKEELQFCYFPPTISNEKRMPSRLAWCYGDLGIAFILYQAAVIFEDINLENFSLKILKESTIRKNIEETIIWDAAICHGSSGVAHIYNKMAFYTGDKIFIDASIFWINRTLEFSFHEDGIGGYKGYNNNKKIWENNPSLLEGSIGICLVLLSYVYKDFSWDYCIMLND